VGTTSTCGDEHRVDCDSLFVNIEMTRTTCESQSSWSRRRQNECRSYSDNKDSSLYKNASTSYACFTAVYHLCTVFYNVLLVEISV